MVGITIIATVIILAILIAMAGIGRKAEKKVEAKVETMNVSVKPVELPKAEPLAQEREEVEKLRQIIKQENEKLQRVTQSKVPTATVTNVTVSSHKKTTQSFGTPKVTKTTTSSTSRKSSSRSNDYDNSWATLDPISYSTPSYNSYDSGSSHSHSHSSSSYDSCSSSSSSHSSSYSDSSSSYSSSSDSGSYGGCD
ncbi:hypothetical protein [Priestia megaterium]|uniref:hypothetical protein n=1 Tax=Priestia megaterium TaxID=1404 RepID=UPI000BFDE3A5|nr:hypothetical protein [Priestia megaterium]PGO60607.1 hypothetical protein CN981_08645 [Priestia megaterium]